MRLDTGGQDLLEEPADFPSLDISALAFMEARCDDLINKKEKGGHMANQLHLRQFMQGIQHWNRWRQRYPELSLDLTGINVSDKAMGDMGRHWDGANLQNTLLKQAMLSGVFFTNAQLQGADLSEAELGSARFWNANLTNACLKGADVYETNFSGAQLVGANLIGVYGPTAEFCPVKFDEYGVFGAANLRFADLSHANLENADFEEASLEEARMISTILNFAHFRKAKLRQAHLQNAQLVGANLEEADLQGANLQGAIFHPANPRYVDTGRTGDLMPIFRGTNLQGADLRGADLTGVDLSHALLDGALFE